MQIRDDPILVLRRQGGDQDSFRRAWQQKGDALYYANYFADKTFNPFVPYPIVAVYFILLTLVVIAVFGAINRRLNRHIPGAVRRIRYRPQVIR